MPADYTDLLDLNGKNIDTSSNDNAPSVPESVSSYTPPSAAKPWLVAMHEAEKEYGLPHNMLVRQAQQESYFNPEAKSSAGAVGLMQIMPNYHPGVDPTDPLASIKYAAKFDRQLYDQFGSWDLALAAYNTGPGNVKKAGKDISKMASETQDYVKRIGSDINLAMPDGQSIKLPAAEAQPQPQPFPSSPAGFVPGIGSQDTSRIPDESGGPGFVESVTGGFSIGWEEDVSVNAISRINEESAFQRDPTYRLSDNHDELLKDVPQAWQDILDEQLVDARSLEHAQYIKAETIHELENAQKQNEYGAWGVVGRLTATVVDPANVALAAVGPVAASYRALRVGSMLARMSKAQRVAVFGAAAATENIALEAVIQEGKKTGSPVDYLYAGAAGFLLGGLGGAFARPKAIHPDVTAEGHAGRAEDVHGHDVTEPDVASMAQRQLDTIDESVSRTLDGQQTPDAKPPEVLVRQAEEMNSALDNEVGAVAEPPVARSAADTAAIAKSAEDAKIRAKELRTLAKNETRLKQIAETDIPAPVKSRILTLLEDAHAAMAKFRAADVSSAAKKSTAEIALNKSKIHLMSELRKEDPELFHSLGLTQRPKAADYEAFLTTTAKKIATKLEKAHGKEVSKYEKALEKLDAEVEKLKTESKAITDKHAAEDLKTAAPTSSETTDSAGAAATASHSPDTLRITEDQYNQVLADEVPPETFGSKVRFGGYAALNRSPNPFMRWLGSLLFYDSVGAKEAGQVVRASAIERANSHSDAVLGRFAAQYTSAFKDWLKARGQLGIGSEFRIQRLAEFDREVGNAVELGTTDAAVQKGVKAFNKAVKDTFEYAKKSGVEGMDKFSHSDDYLPHIHNSEAFRKLNRDVQLVGAGAKSKNWGAVNELLYQAARRALPELTKEDAITLARKYSTTVRGMGGDAGLNGRYMDLQRIVDPDYLRGILDDLGYDQDGVDYIVKMIEKSNKGENANLASRARRRTLFDMDTSVRIIGEDGVERDLHITELFHREASQLAHSYVRSMGGLAAFADVTKGSAIHLNSRNRIMSVLNKAHGYEVDANVEAQRGLLLNRTLRGEVEYAQMGINSILGIPINDPTSAFTAATRRIMDYNFSTLMGQTAFAQLSEQGSVLAHVGWVRMLKSIPTLAKSFGRDADGRLMNEMARSSEEVLGVGTTALRGRSFSPHIRDEEVEKGLNWYDRNVHRAKLVVGAPMHAVMVLQQRWLNAAIMDKWSAVAAGKHKLGGWERERYRVAGLGDEDLKKIADQFNTHGTKFEDWTDQDTLFKLRDANNRISRRAIQENDMSNVPPMMSQNGWKLLVQFRNFTIGAWEKHLLSNVRALKVSKGRDAEAWANFVYQTGFAGMAYYGLVHTKTIGMDNTRKKKYLKDHLSAEKVGWYIWARTGYSSVIPGMIDTARMAAGFDPKFSGSRGSELSQNLITGSPTYALAMHGFHDLQSILGTALNPDYKFSKANLYDWQYSLPGATLPGIYNVWNAVGSALKLPARSQED